MCAIIAATQRKLWGESSTVALTALFETFGYITGCQCLDEEEKVT
jgi:hypothetical protein